MTPQRHPRSHAVTLLATFVLPCIGLAGCTSTASPRQRPPLPAASDRHPPTIPVPARELRMFSAYDGAPMIWGDLMNAVEWADVIIIGEQHDDAIGHAVQLAVVEDTLARWPGAAVSMEMLERDEQGLVDDYLDGIISRDAFMLSVSETNWRKIAREYLDDEIDRETFETRIMRFGWPDWENNYQPMIDAARDAGAPVIAANAPRRYVRLARSDGYDRLDAIPRDRQQFFDHPDTLPTGPYRDRFWDIMSQLDRPEAPEPEEEKADDESTEPEADEAPVDEEPTTPPAAEEVGTSTEDEPTSQPEDLTADALPDEQPTSQPAEEAGDTPPDEGPTSQPEADDSTAPDAAAEVPTDAESPHEHVDVETEAGETDEAGDEAAPEPHSYQMTDEEIEAMFHSQSVWDATMARSIDRALRSGAPKVIHLVGQFHSDLEGGTIVQLRRHRPRARILSISLQRAEPDGLLDEDQGRADIIIYTGEPPDPVEETDEEEAEAAPEEAAEPDGQPGEIDPEDTEEEPTSQPESETPPTTEDGSGAT